MVRAVAAYHPEDLCFDPPGVGPGAEALFDAPLGSERAIETWWSKPAAGIGLPLLAGLFEAGQSGPVFWCGQDLPLLQAELDRLEAHWATLQLAPDVAADLASRADHFREALDEAAAAAGAVVVY